MKDAINAKVRRNRHRASLVAEAEANCEETGEEQPTEDQEVATTTEVKVQDERETIVYRVGEKIESLYRGRGMLISCIRNL